MDPDQQASKKPADLDLHYFASEINPGLVWQGSRIVEHIYYK